MNNEIILTEEERKLIEERRKPGAHLQNSLICVPFKHLKDEVKEKYIQESVNRMRVCIQDLRIYPRPVGIIPKEFPEHLRSRLSKYEAEKIANKGCITWMIGISPVFSRDIFSYDLYEYYVCLRNERPLNEIDI